MGGALFVLSPFDDKRGTIGDNMDLFSVRLASMSRKGCDHLRMQIDFLCGCCSLEHQVNLLGGESLDEFDEIEGCLDSMAVTGS